MHVCTVSGEVRKVMGKMATTDDEDGEQQPVSITAAAAGRIGQLEFRQADSQ